MESYEDKTDQPTIFRVQRKRLGTMYEIRDSDGQEFLQVKRTRFWSLGIPNFKIINTEGTTIGKIHRTSREYTSGYVIVNAKGELCATTRLNSNATPTRPPTNAFFVMETLFNSSHHLAIYGSLAPGKSNDAVIEDIPGQWLEGHVHGKLYESGWGSDIGFPGIVWQPSGPKVNVHLFVSDHIPEHWQRLDHFEGVEYQRSLVPVHDNKGIIAVANIYEIRSY